MAVRDRIGRYRKDYLPRHNPSTKWREEKFIRKYRLTRRRVRQLARDYGNSGCSRNKGSRKGGGLSYNEQMCLALRYLATGSNFSVVAETQQVTEATVSRCLEDVVTYFYRFSNRFIRWPTKVEDKIRIAKGFHKNHMQKPNVLGCVDGTHMQIISPKHDREAVFINRKGFYSLNTMVVCDSENVITHVDPSWAGSAQDSYCFTSSPLRDQAETGAGWGDFFLLGDSGYGLKRYLFLPYRYPQSREEKLFNTWHRSTRSVVERTIGILKQRWRCLDSSGGYLHHTPEKAAKIITTCACLHNVAVADRVPHLDQGDDGPDRFVRRRNPPRQPRDFQQGNERILTERDEYAQMWFGLQEENQ